jgi:hypothetical protein
MFGLGNTGNKLYNKIKNNSDFNDDEKLLLISLLRVSEQVNDETVILTRYKISDFTDNIG